MSTLRRNRAVVSVIGIPIRTLCVTLATWMTSGLLWWKPMSDGDGEKPMSSGDGEGEKPVSSGDGEKPMSSGDGEKLCRLVMVRSQMSSGDGEKHMSSVTVRSKCRR